MTSIKTALSGVVLAGGLAAGLFGMGAAVAAAQPAPAGGPDVGDPVPAWAPPKPADAWDGRPVVWTTAWGGRWGVWINGAFITLSSNPVTGGG
jgi:hypothetical protein